MKRRTSVMLVAAAALAAPASAQTADEWGPFAFEETTYMAGNRAVTVEASLVGVGDDGPLVAVRCGESESVRIRDGFPVGDIHLELTFDDGPSVAVSVAPDRATGTDAFLHDAIVIEPIKQGLRRGATLTYRMCERAPSLTVPLTGAAAAMAAYDAACPEVMAGYVGLDERLVKELLSRPREEP
jgi:hypothetical protein